MTKPEPIESQPPAKYPFLPELALLTTVTLWASTFIVTKDAFTHIDVMAFVFIRFLLMTLMAFAILVVIRARHPEIPITPRRSDLPRFLVAGLAGFTFYQLGYNLGLDRTSVFSASLLISTSPLFTILVLTAIGERPPAAAWIGVAVAVVGVAIFLRDKQGGEHSLSGDLLCFMAAAAFGLYSVINRPSGKKLSPGDLHRLDPPARRHPTRARRSSRRLPAGLGHARRGKLGRHRLRRHLPGLHRLHALEFRHCPPWRRHRHQLRLAGAHHRRIALSAPL